MAWKRNEPPPPETPTRGVREPSPRSDRPPARLGPSVTIRGDLAGEEDLLIEGQLEGEVVVRQHSVTVGRSGRVKADIYGKRVVVEGEVAGNLYGVDEVVIRQAGQVEGSAVSPRVTLESGANFRGQIDMNADSVREAFSRWEAGHPDPRGRAERRGGTASPTASAPPPEPSSKKEAAAAGEPAGRAKAPEQQELSADEPGSGKEPSAKRGASGSGAASRQGTGAKDQAAEAAGAGS